METMEKQKVGLSDLTYDQLAAVRNKLGYEVKVLEDKVKALKEKREKVDTELLRRFNGEGITSVKTKNGTPYIVTQTSVSVSDKDAFWGWMEEHNSFDFMNVTANKTNVAAYLEEHGSLPPGLNWSARHVIGLKKS